MKNKSEKRGIASSTLYALLCLSLLASGCIRQHNGKEENPQSFRSWETIKASDTLIVGTMTSPSAFYIYRGEDMGYEYNKVQEFAKAHDIHLDIRITNALDTLKAWITRGEVDLSITPMAMTLSNTEEFDFCGVVDTTAFVLVQQKPTNLGEDTVTIHSAVELNGKSIHVVKSSPEEIRLTQIRDEIGAGEAMHIIPVDTLSSHDLIMQVGVSDSIKLVVADEQEARAYARYNDKIDVSIRLSAPIKYSWVLHKGNQALKDSVDTFFDHYDLAVVDKIDDLNAFFKDKYESSRPKMYKKGLISPFDNIFKDESQDLGWHWTLLASIAYHESHFRPDVVAWSGATGLMGIMPATGRNFGATREELKDPRRSVQIAVKCLKDFRKPFMHIEDPTERLRFTLAAYNAGPGHVQDAMRLAEKHNDPTDKWEESVRKYILLKSNPNYYNDPVCKFGYLRGTETVRYVAMVVDRSKLYQKIVGEK